MTNQQDRELGWDDEISKESEFQLLPAGDYDFTVTNYERARHNGSAKLPPCNKAIVELQLQTPTGTATVKDNFYLHTSVEGFLTAFFTGIGQKRKGEKVTMNWPAAVGATGRLKLKVRKWKHSQTGEDMEGNEVQSYYPKESTAQQAPSYQAPPQQQQTYQQPPAQPNNQYQQPPVNQPPQNTNYGQF